MMAPHSQARSLPSASGESKLSALAGDGLLTFGAIVHASKRRVTAGAPQLDIELLGHNVHVAEDGALRVVELLDVPAQRLLTLRGPQAGGGDDVRHESPPVAAPLRRGTAFRLDGA